MKPQQLTTAELLVKEMSEAKANQFAKTLIDEQKAIDASENISIVTAKVLPLIKSTELQQEVYQLLLGASASFTATQLQLGAALRRINELTENKSGESEPVTLDAEQELGEEHEPT